MRILVLGVYIWVPLFSQGNFSFRVGSCQACDFFAGRCFCNEDQYISRVFEGPVFWEIGFRVQGSCF